MRRTQAHRTPIAADIALEWAQTVAKRHAPESRVLTTDAGAGAGEIRDAVVTAIAEIAEAMANAAPDHQEVLCKDRTEIREWLAWCCDQIGEPDRTTARNRTMPAIGSRGASAHAARPLRRWQGAVRVQLQELGIDWRRGRHDGPCSFSVAVSPEEGAGRSTAAVLRGCTVIEHGWPENESELQRQLLPAVVTALDLEARRTGKRPPSRDTGLRLIREDAKRSCADPTLQPPEWIGHDE